ncbi:MAG: hypothetical protein IT453_10970, partial [Planctomycetes bacterium]|nr:hypothetical protein [Planctomycetota bacterium]
VALLFPAFLSLAAYAPIAWRAHVERIRGLLRVHASFVLGYGSLLAVWCTDPGGVVRWWFD